MNIDSIHAAYEILKGRVMRTPLVTVGTVTTPDGNPILLKTESLQQGGSFKIRGAVYSMACMSDEQRARGVVAYSTGNHAQAVAIAAAQLGVNAVIVMSPDVTPYKIEATERWGATIVMSEPTSQSRRETAERIAVEQGRMLIPPYDHPNTIAGQGTIGLEILDQLPDTAAVFVPIGGGGLIAGIAAAIKQSNPAVRVIGVEPEWENDAYLSFQRGERVSLPAASKSIADAIRVQMLGDLTYPLMRRYVDEIVTVSEAQIAGATLLAVQESRLILEPAGALGLAAAKVYQGTLAQNRPVVAIASGGNITLEALSQLKGLNA